MTTTTTISPDTLARAKNAVRTLFAYRHDMADSLSLMDWLEQVQDAAREAKASGVPIADDVWIDLAEGADEICEDDGLPRLFQVEGE